MGATDVLFLGPGVGFTVLFNLWRKNIELHTSVHFSHIRLPLNSFQRYRSISCVFVHTHSHITFLKFWCHVSDFSQSQVEDSGDARM